MRDLIIKLVQFDIAWHDNSANIDIINALLDKERGSGCDMIVLPETFNSGFTLSSEEVAQDMKGPAVTWMLDTASKFGADVLGSLVIFEDEVYRNRLVVAHPDQTISFYDKRHLFTYAGEGNVFTQGEHRLTFTTGDGWKVCPLICYDLRFPVWSRNTVDYDILIYVANWPAARVDAWRTLLKARAIENQCYSVGVNRIGTDENGLAYVGSSQVYDMAGDLLVSAPDEPAVLTVTLNHKKLTDYRARYNFLPDQDRFSIQ